MKGIKQLLLFIIILSGFNTGAQILDPVKWEFSSVKVAPDEYELVFKANIEKGWKVYSTDLNIPEDQIGPEPTRIIFVSKDGVKLLGGLDVGKVEGPKFDPSFELDLKWYKNPAIIKQRVKLLKENVTIKGRVEFMTCDDTRCLPPDEVPFEFKLTAKLPEDKATGQPKEVEEPVETETGSAVIIDTFDEEVTDVLPADTFNTAEAEEYLEIEEEEKKGLWGYLLAGLGGGLIALLTPCVFPMLPLTVSFFTKSSKNRKKGITNALIYALSIIFIFVGLGFLVTLLFGPDMLNAMASNIYFNLIFFIVFIIFALSFFGAFEITLPSSFVNKADNASEKGGLIGIFFMAFTLVLVSFSCTAPIVGSLLVMIADSGEFWAPLIGMLGFSLALAVPFALFAAFPGWLNSLPKSGSWLNTVKVTLGFVELALALKFLSVVDLAYHWNFLTRDIFIALWIIIAILLGTYLIGKLRFSHEQPIEHISIPRLFFAILAFGFAIYMVPGLWGAPVKLLSGIAPPQHYQEFSLNKIQFQLLQLENKIAKMHAEEGTEGTGIFNDPKPLRNLPTVTTNMECPHELDCYFDYDRGFEIARKTGKPVLLDFTGWACVNCRKMEDNVWSDPKVWELINEKYVLVSLYVDDKTSLPEEHQISKYTNNKVSTVGKLWSDLQRVRFKSNSQPYYVLMDHNEQLLAQPKGYTPDVNDYISFLNKGINQFEEQQRMQQASLIQK